jgi:hypothetical protein
MAEEIPICVAYRDWPHKNTFHWTRNSSLR